MILGHVGEDDVLLVRRGADFFAVRAKPNDDECREETFFWSLNRQGATVLAESSHLEHLGTLQTGRGGHV
jgi:hypothetical protein